MKHSSKIFGYVCLAVSLLFLAGALTIIPISELSPTSPGGYPVFIAVVCVIFGVLIALDKTLKPAEEGALFSPVIVKFMVLLVLYVLAILYIDYIPATIAFLFAAIFVLKKKWKPAVLISVISTVAVVLIFEKLFSVLLP